jgi:hypothetical protein
MKGRMAVSLYSFLLSEDARIEPRGRIRIESMDTKKITGKLESWPFGLKSSVVIHFEILRIRKFLGLPDPD